MASSKITGDGKEMNAANTSSDGIKEYNRVNNSSEKKLYWKAEKETSDGAKEIACGKLKKNEKSGQEKLTETFTQGPLRVTLSNRKANTFCICSSSSSSSSDSD